MLSKKLEKITKLDEQIEKLQNRRKVMLEEYKEEERKDRSQRFNKYGGLLEKLFPDVLKLSDAQLQSFLEMTLLTDHSRKMFENVITKRSVSTDAVPVTNSKETFPSSIKNNNNSTTVKHESQVKKDKDVAYEEYLETLRNE